MYFWLFDTMVVLSKAMHFLCKDCFIFKDRSLECDTLQKCYILYIRSNTILKKSISKIHIIHFV